MKAIRIVLLLLAVAGLSGCILVPWGDDDHDRGRGGGEHHEEHR